MSDVSNYWTVRGSTLTVDSANRLFFGPEIFRGPRQIKCVFLEKDKKIKDSPTTVLWEGATSGNNVHEIRAAKYRR